MKKSLNFLGIIILIGISITSLIACNNSKEYVKEELTKLKEQNKISINGNTLEWIARQEKPFKEVDNKWYFAVWRSNENNNWRIVKFKNSNLQKIILDKYDEYDFKLDNKDLHIHENTFPYRVWSWYLNISGRLFKSVYRWNGIDEPDKPFISPKTGIITNWKEIKEDK